MLATFGTKLCKNSVFILTVITFSLNSFADGAQLYQSKCVSCHGEKGEGNKEEAAPRIAGQFDWYIISQLEAFQKKVRKNPKMDPFIKGLSKSDLEALASYITSLR